ncbi:MlaE family lipid ABC transporter permease subunit [Yoonia maritima]|uniref:ABC transporter permease n=1 Tax=Yoonia maritima TaxID=1435347 RepID=UPI003734D2FA
MSVLPTASCHFDDENCLHIAGTLTIRTLSSVQEASKAELNSGHPKRIDIHSTKILDTAGAWFLIDLKKRSRTASGEPTVDGATPEQAELIATVEAAMVDEPLVLKQPHGLFVWLEELGERTVYEIQRLLEILSFMGLVILRTFGVLVRPWRMRFTSLVYHMQSIGVNAIPIVSLMAFLIGVVLAFQGAAQLRQFGAEVFVVDLIAISILRELGILLTAIIVAGRTGSAFTASIGSMKMREEIDAMRTLGLDPIEVLVAPRVLALILVLPILGFIADMAGLVGGAVMSWIELGVSPGMFQTRMMDSISVTHFWIGLVKAPFFAMIIGVIGCYEGMKVEGNAESLGRLTSQSVVFSIFMVIVADALFSIFFALVGL